MPRSPYTSLFDEPAQPQSPWETWSLTTKAWLSERATDAQVRILAARTRLIDAEASVLEAEINARTRLVVAERRFQTEQQGGEAVQTAVSQLLPLTRAVLERQDAIERLLMEHDRRLNLPPPTPPALPPPPVSLDVVLTDQEIKHLAGKAVKRFSGLPPAEQEAAWSAWRAEIRQRFPGLAAEEICRAARELNEFFS